MKSQAFGSVLKNFPTPKLLEMPSVGIEVLPEAIRFLELVERDGFISVGRFGKVSLSDTQNRDDDQFPNTPSVREALVELKREKKLDLVTVGLPEDKAYIFTTDVPQLSPEEIRAGLELKLDEFVPVPPREAVFDYRIVNVDPSTHRFQVSVCVFPQLFISRYVDLFLSVGLTPVTFELSAQAAVNALVAKEERGVVIVVNIGERDTRLYLTSQHTAHFTSLIAVGGESLTEAVKKYFKVSDAEARKIKIEKGITRRKEDAELFFSIGTTLSALKDEIEKLSAYWDTHRDRHSNSKEKLGKIILCGQESTLAGLPEYLEASIGIPVVLGNVWQNVFSFDSYIPPIPRKESLSYAVAVGLSLRN